MASRTPSRSATTGPSSTNRSRRVHRPDDVIVISDDEPEVKTEPAEDGNAGGEPSNRAERTTEPSASGADLDGEIGRTMEAMLDAGADAETMRRVIAAMRARRSQ